MYLIIIEGTDNIGKDTLIQRLTENFNTITLIHCDGPKGNCFQSYEQDNKFKTYAKNIVNGKYDNTECIIMNRSHIGEYVYGQLYRNRSANDINKMLCEVDEILTSREDLIVKYIQLLSSSIKLRINNDDNKSLSTKNVQLMEKENELFLEVYNASQLDKHLIYVNDEDGFIPKEEIYNEVMEFLNN